MTVKNLKNVAGSIRQKLLNKAKADEHSMRYCNIIAWSVSCTG